MHRPLVFRIATAAGLFALCFAAYRYAVAVPDVVPASAAADVFSAARAMAHVEEIAQRPHPAGSGDHARVRAYVMSEIAKLGIEPVIQETMGVGTRYAAVGRVRNVLARLPGSQPGGPAVMLVSHYDGVAAGPAAGDAASGSAVLLETLRALRAGPALTNDVIALFTDAEETGLLGAAAFAREHPWAADVGVLLNFEARGTHGPSLMFETGAGNLDVVRVLGRVGGARATSLSTTVYRQLPNDTDLSELALLGKPAMNFAFIGGVSRYHTSEDDVAHLDPRSVQHHGNQALALARAFGSNVLPRPITRDAVFFDVPLAGIAVYPMSWAAPLAVLAFALVIVALVRLRRRDAAGGGGGRWLRDVLLGAVGTLGAMLVAAGAAAGMVELLRRWHLAIGSGSPTWNGVYIAAAAFLAFGIAMAAYALVRRSAGMEGARVGALFVWGMLSLLVAVLAPGVSFIFTWPLLFAASAAVVASLVTARWIAVLDSWIAATVAIVMIVPTVYLMAGVALGLGAVGAVVIGVFAALGAWLIVPQLEQLRGGGGWWIGPLTAIELAAFLAGVGAATERFDAGNPTRASLVYAVDGDSGTAWLTGVAGSAMGRDYVRAALATVPGHISGAASPSPPAWMPASYRASGVARAPMRAVPALPVLPVTIVRDTAADSVRTVAIQVTPPPGVLSVLMNVEGGAGTVLAASVDGVTIDRSRYRSSGGRWWLDYIGPAGAGFVLELTLARRDEGVALNLMARTAGLPALDGVTIPPRPPGVLASLHGDHSILYRRLPL
ncbi:MAG: M28 family peptidase [Gemmatimonadaceae bacterium]